MRATHSNSYNQKQTRLQWQRIKERELDKNLLFTDLVKNAPDPTKGKIKLTKRKRS